MPGSERYFPVMANTLPSIDKMLMILSSRQNELDRAYRYSSPQPEPDAPAVTIPPALMSMKTRLAWCQTLVFALEERMELKDVKLRSEERRVGKECRFRWSTQQ